MEFTAIRATAGRGRGCGVRRRGVVRVKESAVESAGGVGQEKQRQGRAVWLVGAG